MAAAAAMLMSDDDDAEPQVSAVENYHLVDSQNHPACFSTLPLRHDETKDVPECKKRLVLWGISDPGVIVYREMVAWRLVLEGKQPEIVVLAVDGNGWIRLVKPKNSYEETIRKVLITAQMLHFLRRKPDEPENKFDVRPSEVDFRNHRSLMKHFAEKDPVLAKSEILRVFVEGRSRQNISEVGADNIKIKQPFIADDEDIDEMVTEDANNESDEEDEDLFDSICAICDNGGDILCCDGPCMRSFHAKKGSGEDSYCDTLGYTEAQVEAMKIFLCKNCEYKQHQCFICGVLEPSDGDAVKGANLLIVMVFISFRLGYGKGLGLVSPAKSSLGQPHLQKPGFSGCCPFAVKLLSRHVGRVSQEDHLLLYKFQCVFCSCDFLIVSPFREISFQDIEEEDIITRAWELSKRILIYCLDHEIDSEIDTPVRDHIKFPKVEKPAQFFNKGDKLLVKKKKRTFNEAVLDQPSKDTGKMKGMVHVQKSELTEQTSREVSTKSYAEDLVSKPEKKKAKLLKEKIQPEPRVAKDPSVSSPKPVKEQEQELVVSPSSATRKIPLSSFPIVDSEAEKRVIAILGNEASKLTLKDVTRKCSVPSTHVYSGRQVDKIAQGKIERSVQAVGAALKKLENGGNVNDAKAVCEPDVLRQLAKWLIVDKLHWYVEPGDTIVDFCCGANDFCWLMKEKLDKVPKKCHFKNYDLIQPKNHFGFEKRDWMTVKPNELPCGSQLIMGLNPPFGVKASLANKFIDKALSFKPKLVVLIVPKETKRLDQKRIPYDLIWEDSECLAGKGKREADNTACNDREANVPDDHTAKKQDRSEEKRRPLGKIAVNVKEANMSDNLPVKKQTEPTSKVIPGKDRENGSYESRPDNRRKCPPDYVESLPPEKQVEVAYEETKVTIPRKESIQNEHRGACYGNRRNSRGEEIKSARRNYEQTAAGMLNIKSMDGGDSDMSISSPDSNNARSKSRSYSPALPTENPSDRIVHPDSYCPSKELYDPMLNRATYKGSYSANNDEYFDALKFADIDNSSRMRGSSIDEVTRPYFAAPASLYSMQSRDDGSLYRRPSSEYLNTTTSGRSLVADVATQGQGMRYDGQIGDSRQASRIPPTTGSRSYLSMHDGTGADYLSATYSHGSFGARFSQPASSTPSFGLSGAGLQRDSVMDKYAYGLSGPSGPQSSVMDKYAPSLDGRNNTRPESSLPQQYPFGRPVSYGGGWPQN
ncbi:uncharacterized protein C2845_PM04G16980 [Panicum miliaceum]|uniref:Uncharacterized protein n=1 Tax=Panicum miliaceum TaxID=4540 RepID=A0A3L6QPU9_PANMI|nr:uncharacterized protein C2845_PM04G16980 [Panicum miliaceum]